MPIPTPRKTETKEEFISRCMGDGTMVKEYDKEQRAAICYSQWEEKHGLGDDKPNLEQAKLRLGKIGN